MFKKLVFICLVALCTSVGAKEVKDNKFQIVANKVDSENNVITAYGDVVIFSSSYYASAQKVIYNKKDETFEFFDDVLIIKDNQIQTQSDYAFLDNKTNALFQKPTLIFEGDTNLWINSEKSNKKEELVTLEKSILSSCDCEDPDWSIKVSSAEYNSETKWLHTFNTRLYIKDIPILYTPYFGFSTDRTRRTGLLIPTVGYGSDEGFLYSQPIYIAPAPNYDIELIPQYKARRGKGLNTYFRYADSENSILKLSAGMFKEDSDYFLENQLENQNHYGWSIDYERNRLFSKGDSQDGLFVDASWLSDIEYRNLEPISTIDEDNEKKVESKINYFYNSSKYYTGLYFRYYLDTSKESNKDTMQELPQAHFHKYSEPIFLDNLLYSTDVRYTNHYREEGITANRYDINIPISYSLSFFDDYLQLTLKNETVINHLKYDDSNLDYEDGTFIENITSLGLSTDLIKPYENFLHTVNLGADYIDAKTIEDDGDLFSINNNTSELSFFPVSKTKRSLLLSLNQSLYDRDNLKQIVNHKLKQSIIFDEFNDPKLQNMENEIVYNYFLGTLSNKVIYSHLDNTFIENSTSFSLNYNDFTLRLGYYMSKDTPNSGKQDLESYRADMQYKISRDYSIGYYTNYNLEENMRTKQGLRFSINDSCWNLDFKFEKEMEASSSKLYDRKEQDVLYVQFLLKPIGGLQQEYNLRKKER